MSLSQKKQNTVHACIKSGCVVWYLLRPYCNAKRALTPMAATQRHDIDCGVACGAFAADAAAVVATQRSLGGGPPRNELIACRNVADESPPPNPTHTRTHSLDKSQ